MKSLSECYVVHFISETGVLYHISETEVNARIEKFLSCQSRADFGGVWIGPFKGERSALLGLHGIDAAEVVLRQIGARAVRTALENQALAIWRDFSLAFDELCLAHSKKRRDVRNLRVRHAHDSVLDAAARPAHPALEIIQFHHLVPAMAFRTTRRFTAPAHLFHNRRLSSPMQINSSSWQLIVASSPSFSFGVIQ